MKTLKNFLKKLISNKIDNSQSIKLIDFGSKEKRYWGHNFNLVSKLDNDGYKWNLSCWYPCQLGRPNVNDFISLALSHDNIKIAVIEKVKSCGNPSDMYFLEINIKNAIAKFKQWNDKKI
jgi:hypothetical protein